MKRVDTIARVRRAFHIQGWSMKKIVRELHVSRNTVRKILRSGETDFSYERERQPMPRLGPWQGQLEHFLSANAGKPSRERLTLIRIFEELRGLGYEGGYDAVRRFARTWSQNRGAATAEAYVPLSYAPGEAYQFDWSHEVILNSGVTLTVKVAHVRLRHSRMMFARAYMRESQEMVFDAHDRAFAFFKGTCTRGIYDNMKTAVEAVFTGKERQYNRRFMQMCSHFLVQPVACTPASGWEKGQVENQVGLVRERFFEYLLGHPPPAQRAYVLVGVQRPVADELCEAPCRHVPAKVHLEEAILGVDIALREEQVLGVVGVDLRDALVVALHCHIAAQGIEPNFPRCIRKGLAHGDEGKDGTRDQRARKQDGQDDQEATHRAIVPCRSGTAFTPQKSR